DDLLDALHEPACTTLVAAGPLRPSESCGLRLLGPGPRHRLVEGLHERCHLLVRQIELDFQTLGHLSSAIRRIATASTGRLTTRPEAQCTVGQPQNVVALGRHDL